jgi:hypothetical protein
MAGGLLAVLTISLLFGSAAEMWNRMGLSSNGQSNSGFLCAAIAMRSMLGKAPLMLPTTAPWIWPVAFRYVRPGVAVGNRSARPLGRTRTGAFTGESS